MLADLAFVGVLVAVVALIAAWEIFCLYDLARAQRVRFLPRWLWAVVCLAQIPLGGIAYLLVGKVWRRRTISNPPG